MCVASCLKSLLTALGIWQSRDVDVDVDVDVEQCGNAVWQALTCKDSVKIVKKISRFATSN